MAIQTEIDTDRIGPCNCECKSMFSDIQCKSLDKILYMAEINAAR